LETTVGFPEGRRRIEFAMHVNLITFVVRLPEKAVWLVMKVLIV
jgi:hypothetical protein